MDTVPDPTASNEKSDPYMQHPVKLKVTVTVSQGIEQDCVSNANTYPLLMFGISSNPKTYPFSSRILGYSNSGKSTDKAGARNGELPIGEIVMFAQSQPALGGGPSHDPVSVPQR